MEYIKAFVLPIAAAVIAIAFMGTMTPDEKVPAPNNTGSITGPDINYPYLSVGGIRQYHFRTDSLIQATSSVICSIQSPAATSTLVDGSIQLTVSSTTGATPLTIYNSVLPYSAGEIIATVSAGEDVPYFLPAASSTFNGAAIRDRIFAGNSYFVVTQTGGGMLTQSGTCQASFREAY